MSTRPAWRATLTNHSRGWSYTAQDGDTYDPTDVVHLADGWSVQWEHADGQQWTPLLPVVTAVKVLARTTADLPTINYDDEMSLHLVRPLEGGLERVWLRSFGGVTDLDAAVDNDSAQLSITFVDPRAVLDARTHYPTADPFPVNAGMAGAPYTAPANPLYPGGWVDPRYIPDVSYAQVLDLYASIENADGWLTWRIAHRYVSETDDGMTTGAVPGPYRYYFEVWPVPEVTPADALPALFTLETAAGILTAGDANGDATPAPVTVLDACAILSPVPWKKDATSGEVAVDATGMDGASWNGAGYDRTLELTVGPSPSNTKHTRLTLPTLLETTAGLQAAAEDYRALYVTSTEWRTPSLTIDTSLLTDAQLDYLADGRLYPRQMPYDIARGISPVVIVGADPDANLSGALLFGLPIGATFRLTGGDLLIDLDLSPWLNRYADPAALPGPSYAALEAAHPSIDYAHTDPILSYEDLKYAGL